MYNRKEETAKRKLELQEKLKIGAFVKNVWGATMQRVSYFEIVSIEKNKIGLKPALISGDHSPNCASSEVTLLGANKESSYGDYPAPCYANIRMGYLVQDGKSIRDYWSTYKFVEIGDKTSTWSD